jgi:hypothetical protein
MAGGLVNIGASARAFGEPDVSGVDMTAAQKWPAC